MKPTLFIDFAAFMAFANFVLNAGISFTIWWRVMRPNTNYRARRFMHHSAASASDKTFKLIGYLFAVLAGLFLTASLWRANDISLHTYSKLQMFWNIAFFSVSLFAAFTMIRDEKLRWIIPALLGAFSMMCAGVFVYISVL